MKLRLLLLTTATVLFGCVSDLPQQDEVSLLNSKYPYQQLDYKTDEHGLFWKGDDFKAGEYQNIVVKDINIQLSESIKAKVSSETVEKFEKDIEVSLKAKTLKHFPCDVKSKKQAFVDINIIKIQDLEEDINALEVTPVGAAVGFLKMVAGTRDRSVRVIVDVDIRDLHDEHLLARRVFAVNNHGVLENNSSKITSELLDKNVDVITQQGVQFILQTLYM